MFPIALNLARIPVLLIGQGALLEKREKQLAEYGATQVTVIDLSASQTASLPLNEGKHTIVMVAGLDRSTSETISTKARAEGKLVNVEDMMELCDFYFTANVRRGDLVIAVSTCGASPTLARKVRDRIAELFGVEWAERTQMLAELRQSLKKTGASMKAIMEQTEAFLAKKGWLS